MLVLTRKIGESIIIGHDIELKVLSSDGNTFRIGIEAPNDVRILRKELYEEILKENQLATQLTTEESIQSLLGLIQPSIPIKDLD